MIKKILLALGAVLSGLYTLGAIYGAFVAIKGDDPRMVGGVVGVAAAIAVAAVGALVFVACLIPLLRRSSSK